MAARSKNLHALGENGKLGPDPGQYTLAEAEQERARARQLAREGETPIPPASRAPAGRYRVPGQHVQHGRGRMDTREPRVMDPLLRAADRARVRGCGVPRLSCRRQTSSFQVRRSPTLHLNGQRQNPVSAPAAGCKDAGKSISLASCASQSHFSERLPNDGSRCAERQRGDDSGNEQVGPKIPRASTPSAASITAKLPMTSLRVHSHTNRMFASPSR